MGKVMGYLSGFTAKFYLGVIALLLACAPLAYCKGRSDGTALERGRWEAAQRAADKRASAATNAAAEQRAADTIRNSNLERARQDAIAQNPGNPRRALNCERLRQASLDAAAAGC